MAGIKHHQVFDQNREQQELTGAEAINTVESVHSQTDVCCVTSKNKQQTMIPREARLTCRHQRHPDSHTCICTHSFMLFNV